eukprot:9254294-Pyramimonas_sp.AAC.1
MRARGLSGGRSWSQSPRRRTLGPAVCVADQHDGVESHRTSAEGKKDDEGGQCCSESHGNRRPPSGWS